MITHIAIQNFKSLRDVSFATLGRLNVFVGPNGSGKSSVLQALVLNDRALREELAADASSNETLIRTASSTGAIRISVQHDVWNAVTYSLINEGRWRCHVGNCLGFSADNLNDANSMRTLCATLAKQIGRARLISLQSDRIRAYSPASMGLQDDGCCLASALRTCQAMNPHGYEIVMRAAAAIIPGFIGLRYDTPSCRTCEPGHVRSSVQMFVKHLDGARIPFMHADEGTLRVLAYLTAVVCAPVGAAVLIDNIDSGLHPLTQKALVEQLRALLVHFPYLQLFVTTHSPYLVDQLHDTEIWQLARDKKTNATAAARLTDHPDFERWRSEMFRGEFWSYVGDEWVLSSERRHA